ncbi:MAG TPA: NAD(P)/FAD-dependent oxidoreductase [Cyclobacteriaceae bacterium]
MSTRKRILIVGAGPVGSLLAIYLIRKNYAVTLLERRPDMRKSELDAGRSINLALSNRGLRPLIELGLQKRVSKMIIPMKGRFIHDASGKTSMQPYGVEGQVINSISRPGLNELLLNVAENEGCRIIFDSRATEIDVEATKVESIERGKKVIYDGDVIIGSDGAFSAIRTSIMKTDRFDYSQFYIEHGYKELSIPSNSDGSFRLEKNALHIWPRGHFMLIALPNLDGSFTVTLFFPFEGEPSFASLNTKKKVRDFFKATFVDAFPHLVDLDKEFEENPTSSLVTVRCFPWVKNNTLLIGDAAHAVVPFYGQGMNCGFEDCRVLNSILTGNNEDWRKTLSEFEKIRKPDADAISELALRNFIEMRDLVANENFVLQKKIESKLHKMFPERWIPLYSMVTFQDHIRYSDALKIGNKQQEIMNDLLKKEDIKDTWESLDFASIVKRLESQKI